MTRVATLHQQRPGGVGDTSPAWGRPVAHILLCLCCVCVFSGNFLLACCSKCVSTCLARPGVIFLRAGALQASFVLLHPCLRILLAIYSSEDTACMHQLMCTAVSQLRSDQLIPLHLYAHLMYPACLFVLYIYVLYTTFALPCMPDFSYIQQM
jgi:hypothetical protein